MEKGNLRRVKAGGTYGHDNITLGDHTNLSGGLHSVGLDDGLKLEGSTISKDQAKFTFTLLDECIQLGLILETKLLIELTVINILLVSELSSPHADGLLNDGVLTDQQGGTDLVKTLSNPLDLIGTNVQ